MKDSIRTSFELWKKKAVADPDLAEELSAMVGREDLIEDAFFKDLEFGTAGLRGVIGAGTNRMNVYTVALTSYAMALYVLKYGEGERSIAISYDSRIKSELFAETAARVFAAAGVKAYLTRELMPTPFLSYAVRALKADAGVMITASHNPAKYNGYKVYGPDGCQMTSESADKVLALMKKTDCFSVDFGDFEALQEAGLIEYISEDLTAAYLGEVKKQSVLSEKDRKQIDRNVAIVYTPLNGAGFVPVMRMFRETGFTNVTVVEEQKAPDGRFPTCTYPNPEIRATMALGIEYCRKADADMLVATDPDSDRLSIAVRDGEEYRILTGNETGCLLLDFVARCRKANKTLPERPVAVKSIVTSELASKIAASYGIEMRNVLTGFKYIGEQILHLEQANEEERFIFGFEESCGFLSGTYCRDKDAVNAALLVTEMFAFYKSRGKSLVQVLHELGERFGYYENEVRAFEYEGIEGLSKMKEIMKTLRKGVKEIGGIPVSELVDYEKGIDGLPKADVLKFVLNNGGNVIVRPSGTEPKIKVYVTSTAKDRSEALSNVQKLFDGMGRYL